jgi:hypothetical protein
MPTNYPAPEQLGLTPLAAATLFGQNPRTMRYSVAGTRKILPRIAILIRLMVAGRHFRHTRAPDR